MLYACIMAGGSGTRLWPVSRKTTPKQVKPFIDDKTLLQKTYERLLLGFSEQQIYVATNATQVGFIKDQLPNLSLDKISAEPAKRDTAAAIALATLRIYKKDPSACVININSDAYVIDNLEYIRVIKEVEKFLSFLI